MGGIEASQTYAGVSGGVGLNQINFTVPAGLSGCNVSLVVQSDTTPVQISNSTTIPIAPNGGACTDSAVLAGQIGIDAALAKGSVTIGAVQVDADQKQAAAFILRFTPAQWAVAKVNFSDPVSPGNCTTFVLPGQGGNHSGNPNDSGIPAGTGLDAGTITMTPPAGASVALQLQQAGIYAGNIATVTSGSYKFSGAGGKDIGPFSVSLSGPPSFTWTNSNIKTVVRNQGLKITWAGGDANSVVNISGYTNGSGNSYTQFECLAPIGPGQFTVPASTLLALTPANGSTPNGSVFVYIQSAQQVVIPGTDFSIGGWNTNTVNASEVYQ